MPNLTVTELMARTGVAFGTSGARGLVTALTDEVCYGVTRAFLRYLAATERPGFDPRVLIAGDLRPSSERIARAALRAALDTGRQPVWCGGVPTPAVAVAALERRVPAMMVTGSHIPDDRNGIKFYKPAGEILKADEAAIVARKVTVPENLVLPDLPPPDGLARAAYLERWRRAFPPGTLAGLRIGVYEHSAVGRDVLGEIFAALGAEVLPFGRSAAFVPVDTEAIRPEDEAIGRAFARETAPDAIVSTDGDGDRPLISDEAGRWLRGDVACVIAARELGAEVVVTPVSSNTVVERCGAFRWVLRTRIGSPYVIEAMQRCVDDGARGVVGYEANGGFLTATPLCDGLLPPLPTRDPVIVQVALLAAARRRGCPVSALLAELPSRHTASDRLQDFPAERSNERIAGLLAGGTAAVEAALPDLGAVASIDTTDGLRIGSASGEVVHFRPSGNAPELRCYAEADTPERAAALVRSALAAF